MAGSYPSPKGIHPFLLLALVVGGECVCGWGGVGSCSLTSTFLE